MLYTQKHIITYVLCDIRARIDEPPSLLEPAPRQTNSGVRVFSYNRSYIVEKLPTITVPTRTSMPDTMAHRSDKYDARVNDDIAQYKRFFFRDALVHKVMK